jgi:lipopolysaccharide transport system ATP-binding protein
MGNVAISVEGLGKRYRIGSGPKEPYGSLRESMVRAAQAPLRRLSRGKRRPDAKDMWALRDVSFEVKHGEAVGIIGRNGAGKSTLLKVLSRITEPTAGRAVVHGRVGSLLEVGTGFHPELTGRENVFLNGAVMGMSRAEIKRHFDEIVDFSGVEQFLDTPVKRYSSGMYMRLAFAVAAHLEPEVLVVDEVLAVGDADFQKKCLGKMSEVSRSGRTVLFVSHQMAAVESLCRRGIVLQKGQVQFVGSQTEAVAEYLTSSSQSVESLNTRKDRSGTGDIRVTAIEVRDPKGQVLDIVTAGQDIELQLPFEKVQGANHRRVIASVIVKNSMGVPIFLQHNRLTRDEFGEIPASGVFVCHIRKLPLPSSTYRVGFSISAENGFGDCLDGIDDAAELTVTDGDFYGSGEIPPVSHGLCLVDAQWRLETSSTAGSC